MGCYKYAIDDSTAMFSEGSEDVGCLCTFPHNDVAFGQRLSPGRVRSLAYLGAMVALIAAKRGENPDAWYFIPSDLPEWIRSEIDRVTGYTASEQETQR